MNIFTEFASWWAALLGFLAGLLGPIIVDRNRRALNVTETQRAILLELTELRYRLAGVAFGVYMDAGLADKTFLMWYRAILVDAHGQDRRDSILETVDTILAYSDAELIASNAFFRQKYDASGKAKGLQKVAAPLLEAKFGDLSTLPIAVQNALLGVRAHLQMFNEEVDRTAFYLELSFKEMSAGNYEIARQNGAAAATRAAERAKIVAEKITAVPGMALGA